MPQVKALACPNCGGVVQLRGYAQTVNAVCEHCLTILDARTPELAIIQTVQAKQRITPLIPLGSRGKLLGMGLSTYIEVCGVAPSKWIGAVGEGWGAAMWESANIRVTAARGASPRL